MRWNKRSIKRDQAEANLEEATRAVIAAQSGFFTVNQFRSAVLGIDPSMQTAPVLPTREQSDAIRVFKLAKIVCVDGAIKLQGVGAHAIYNVDATAECKAVMGILAVSNTHVAPEVGCTCGFYGVPQKHAQEITAAYANSRFVRIEVELFGRVVKHERGYRAQRQRVLSVSVPRQCRTLAPSSADPSMIVLRGYPTPEIQCSETPIGMRLDGGYVVPSCATHAPLGSAPLTDVAKAIGVQVRWDD